MLVNSQKLLTLARGVAAVTLFCATNHRALALDFYLQPSAWAFVQDGDDVVFPKKYDTRLSISAGFVTKSSIALVGKYLMDRSAASLSGSKGTSQKFASLAGGIGYHQDEEHGLFLDGLVYLFPTYTESYDADSTVYYGKYGFGLDASYLFKFGNASFGPMLSVRRVEYSKIYSEDNAYELKTKPHFLQMVPLLSSAISF